MLVKPNRHGMGTQFKLLNSQKDFAQLCIGLSGDAVYGEAGKALRSGSDGAFLASEACAGDRARLLYHQLSGIGAYVIAMILFTFPM